MAETAASPVQFTVDQIVKLHFETADALKALAERHAAERAPLENRDKLCIAWLQRYLNESGVESARTDHGTAYKSTVLSATVDPEGGWDSLMHFILNDGLERFAEAMEKGQSPEEALAAFKASPRLALFNRAVNKSAVKEILEQGGEVPGVKVAQIVNVNVRRS